MDEYERGWSDGYKLAYDGQVKLMKERHEKQVRELEKQINHWKEIARR